jgi:hypothetical protein
MALTLEFRPHNSRARRHDPVIITQIRVQRDEPIAGDLAATRVDSDGVIHPMAKGIPPIQSAGTCSNWASGPSWPMSPWHAAHFCA